jgi:hypothetical protein
MKHKTFGKVAVCVAALTFLGGCSLYQSAVDYFRADSEGKCPDLMILAEGATLPAFDPAKADGDPSGLVYTVTMTDVTSSCSYRKKKNKTSSDFVVTFKASRAGGGDAAVYKVPYFLAVTINGKVVKKTMYSQEIAFEAGASHAEEEVDLDDIETWAAMTRQPADYHYVVGFQLTRAQLDYVKKMGRFGP